MNSDWTKPFLPDEHTIALYHFDEGEGNEARDACGDPELTLRAEEALWSVHPGFGSSTRFERRDANIWIGPTNNDRLHLRGCDKEWTIEAWVRYTGRAWPVYPHWRSAQVCGTDDEGCGLPVRMRGGWNLFLCSAFGGPCDEGFVPGARFLGSFRGKDPTGDTGGQLLSLGRGEIGWLEKDRGRFTDTEWHHIAWQFRYVDQTNFF